MLKPLSRGRHTISVGANYAAQGSAHGGMQQSFEYELDVGGEALLSDVTSNCLDSSAAWNCRRILVRAISHSLFYG